MGHSRASKQATHERVVNIAAQRFCERGLEGVSIADLMKEAGLTHGGFYKHFDSREQLVGEALTAAFNRSKAAPRRTLETLVTQYLSSEHRDAPGTGCAVGALVNDIGRSEAGARDLYTQKLQANIDGIAHLLGSEDHAKRAEAIVLFSAMVGAIGLARAVSDEGLSREILDTVRDAFLAPSDFACPV